MVGPERAPGGLFKDNMSHASALCLSVELSELGAKLWSVGSCE